jgi:hypothetical protein
MKPPLLTFDLNYLKSLKSAANGLSDINKGPDGGLSRALIEDTCLMEVYGEGNPAHPEIECCRVERGHESLVYRWCTNSPLVPDLADPLKRSRLHRCVNNLNALTFDAQKTRRRRRIRGRLASPTCISREELRLRGES